MKKRLIFCLLYFLLGSTVCIGQIRGYRVDPNLTYQNQDWGWIDERWAGDNSVYLKIATNIRKEIASGKNLESSWDKYLRDAEKNPKNAKAQFARAFFLVNMNWGRKLNLLGRKTGPASELLIAWQGLVKADSPRCREYARIRFLINCKEEPHLKLTPMGKRLFESGPTDHFSKYYYITLLNYSRDVKVLKLAQALASEMVSSKPKDYTSYGLLASSYSSMWLAGRDKKNALLSIENYQKSIDLSKDKEWNSWATHLIKVLRDEIKKARY